MYEQIKTLLTSRGIPDYFIHPAMVALSFLLTIALVILASWFANKFLIPVLERAVKKSSTNWDDILAENNFFIRISRLLPIVLLFLSVDLLFPDDHALADLMKRLAMALFVVVIASALDSILVAVRRISASSELKKHKAFGSYLDAARIIVLVLAVIFLISVIANKSPWGIISIFGGLTAVILLIFKDTILGFIGSVQLTALDMVRVGDWIEVPQFNTDGDVIDISIHTIKVRNWDKTISTIPTYALITNSFKNWRGMSESGGRRIKRSIFIDMKTIKFCSDEMMERFSRFALLQEYLRGKKAEIDDYNSRFNIDTSVPVNGRRQTNIGVFRAYVTAYLRAHPKISKEMTFLVRHLQPTPQGLPLEIYVFSNDQVWANYEGIQADIMDHILAAAPEFELRVFQYPSGNDFSALTNLKPA